MEEQCKGGKILEREAVTTGAGSRNVVLSICLAAISLIVGGMIYLCFRPVSLVMFRWIDAAGFLHVVESLRASCPFSPPDWVVFSLPDGLWVYSYMVFMGWIWNFSLKKAFPFLIVVPVSGIVSEIAQLSGWLPGIFDMGDLIAYIMGTGAGIINLDYIKRSIDYENIK